MAWKQFELGSTGAASINSKIAAVSRIPTSMELWWVGANGSVQGAYWYRGVRWQRYELAPAGSASTSGGITAVSRIPTSMELWWVGANGSIQDAYWYEGAQWQRFELAPARSASTSGGITAVSRIPTSMELWWVGANGSIQDAYWYEGAHADSANLAITLRAIADQGRGRFIEVSGSGFTRKKTVNLVYLFKLESDVSTSQSGRETLRSDGEGGFVSPIRVTLTDITSAEVKATDVASGATVTALLEGR